jgi:hypothetical protein
VHHCTAPTDPTTPPTNPPPATGCTDAPEWAIGSVYTSGNLVKHEKSRSGDPNGPASGQGKHLWRAKYWTRGSEPGWTTCCRGRQAAPTDQSQDLGRC